MAENDTPIRKLSKQIYEAIVVMRQIAEMRKEVSQHGFDVRMMEVPGMKVAIAGDGEVNYLFMLLPFRDKFKLKKRDVWLFKKLSYKFQARPFLVTFDKMLSFYPLHALEEAGEHFELDIRNSRGLMFSFDTIVSEQLQQRLVV